MIGERSRTEPTAGRRRGRLGGCLGVLVKIGLAGLLLAIVARELAHHGPVRIPQPLPVEPILDLHTHVAGIGAGGSGCFVSESMATSYKFLIYLWALGVTEEEVRRQGDGLIVDRLARVVASSRRVGQAVVLAMDGVVTDGELDRERTVFYVPNDFVARETARHRQLLFGASVNPHRKDALERLVRAREQGAVLVKWIPSIMDIDPADPALDPFYRKLVELDLPLLSHAGQERSFVGARDELADPVRLVRPLELGVTVIAAHIATTGENAGQDNFERILPLFARFPNLYADISSLTQVNKLGALVRALSRDDLIERLVYGSDYPLQFVPLVHAGYQALSLTWSQILDISRIANPLDRDVMIKHAVGVPAGVFTRGRHLILDRETGQGSRRGSPARDLRGAE